MSFENRNIGYDTRLLTNSVIQSKRFGIVVSEWHKEITDALYLGSYRVLLTNGIPKSNIISKTVPGSYELTFGAQQMAKNLDIDAIICLGCVIRGETSHFEYICQAVTQGLTTVGLKFDKPVVFGVLTTNNLEQAKERAGGELGNKGEESSVTALKLLNF